MSDDRPLALLVTAFVPHPRGGGPRMRAWDWALELAQDHRLVVGLVGDDPTDRTAIAALAEVVGLPTHQARPWLRRLARLIPPLAWWRPRYTAAWHLPDTGSDWPERPAERVVTFRMHVHEVARLLGAADAHRQLDLDDRESATLRSVAGSLWRLGRRREALTSSATALQYAGVERRLLRHYEIASVASATDHPRASRTTRRRRADLQTRPNRIGPLTARPPRAVPPSPTLLFVGTLNYPPNTEAVNWLIGPIRTALHAAGIRCRIVIAGFAPPAALATRLAALPDVRLEADVPDLAPLYREADVVIAPLRAGGGTKIKTVEAIGHGLPVIGSPEAFRGLPVAVSDRCEVMTTPAEAVLALHRLQACTAADLGRRIEAARRALEPAWLRPAVETTPEAAT